MLKVVEGVGSTAPGQQPAALRVGACVTLAQLSHHLQATASAAAVAAASGKGAAAAAAGGAGWAGETAAHLSRIAGAHVRNAATVGGNLVLARERCLPSDVATLLVAAGEAWAKRGGAVWGVCL